MTIFRYAVLVLGPWMITAALAAEEPAKPPEATAVQTARVQPAALPSATPPAVPVKAMEPLPGGAPAYADDQFEQPDPTAFEAWWLKYTDALRRAE
jgi:hypothetical protein